MARAKAKELNNRHDGDRAACPICSPPDPRKRIRADRLWAWSLRNVGESPLRTTQTSTV